MKITVLRQMPYEETNIYVMQFDYSFQYLYAWNNQIYQDRIESKPAWWKRILWRLHIIDTPYTKDDFDTGEQIVLSGAMKSIDTLKGKSQQADEKK